MRDTLFHILFVWYPYVCIGFFVVGSLFRFERDQYSWRAGSSQLLRRRQLFWGSNLFHFGIIFLFFGHLVGLLTPKSIYTLIMTVEQKQMLAVTAGGIAGAVCFVGLTLLLHRRLFDPRIRITSTTMDLADPHRAVGAARARPDDTAVLARALGRLGDAEALSLGARRAARCSRAARSCSRIWSGTTSCISFSE